MFKVLDEDGSNSLSIGEITKLFKENGINMTRTEVALMFANA
jgi:Ca2+-binding EF-hand superfamily protein